MLTVNGYSVTIICKIHPKSGADIVPLKISCQDSALLTITMSSPLQSHNLLHQRHQTGHSEYEEIKNRDKAMQQPNTKKLDHTSNKPSKKPSNDTCSFFENEINDGWGDWEWNEINIPMKSSVTTDVSKFPNKNVPNDSSMSFQIDDNENFNWGTKSHDFASASSEEMQNLEKRSDLNFNNVFEEQNSVSKNNLPQHQQINTNIQRSDFQNQAICNYFTAPKSTSSTLDLPANDHSFNSLVYVSQAKPVPKPSKQFASLLPLPVDLPEFTHNTPSQKQNITNETDDAPSFSGTYIDTSPCGTSASIVSGSSTSTDAYKFAVVAQNHQSFSVITNTSPKANYYSSNSVVTNAHADTFNRGNSHASQGMSSFASIDDRNQYLQTSHLSESNFINDINSIASQETESLPPPGLSRLVLGEPEHDNQLTERMIPGTDLPTSIGLERQIDGEDTAVDNMQQLQRLPFGGNSLQLDRSRISSGGENLDITGDRNLYMVPGESVDNDQRIVTGLEALLNHANTPPSPVTTREIELDGENLEDVMYEQTLSPNLTKSNRNENIQTNLVRKTSGSAFSNFKVEPNVLTLGIKDFASISTENESDYPPSLDYKKNRKSTVNEKKRKTYDSNGRFADRCETSKFDPSSQEESLNSENNRGWLQKERKLRERKYQNTPSDKHLTREKKIKDKKTSRFNSNIPTDDSEHKLEYMFRGEHSIKNCGDKSADHLDDNSDYYDDYQRYRKHRFDHDRDERKRRGSERRHGRQLDSRHQCEISSRSQYSEYRKNSSRTTRESDVEKDHTRERKSRIIQNMYSYPSNFGYDPYTYYYEQIYRTNPQAYSEWYKKYYGFQNEEIANDGRQSVHSGRSSVHNEKKRQNVIDLQEEKNIVETSINSMRSTPCKFTKEHSIASFSSGALILVNPSLTVNKTCNIIKLIKLNINDSKKNLLEMYPGPLIRGVTHKTTAIEFCEEQIKLGPSICMIDGNEDSIRKPAKQSSFTLLWRLLILLLRQNGIVVGPDIAELLMQNQLEFPYVSRIKISEPFKSNDVLSSENHFSCIVNDDSAQNNETFKHLEKSTILSNEDKITETFRNYLLYGNITEALRWATDNNLWGHALFLASKMDQRSHANVMLKFANKLPLNDPLQTLYQLMSGRKPSSVTSVHDENWGDWRPHLSMILSNSFQQPELNQKSITTLGDSLLNNGDFYAAQFCYLMAQVDFGKYQTGLSDATIKNFPKLILLGSSHLAPFMEFATNEAIMMTEIYEYACSLNEESFCIPEFQPYKYLLATRMLDYGYHLRCLLYLEQISLHINCNVIKYEKSFVDKVYQLAERLKFHDPIFDESFQDQFNTSLHNDEAKAQQWFQNLRALVLQNKNTNTFQDYTSVSHSVNEHQQQVNIDQQFVEMTKQFDELQTKFTTPSSGLYFPSSQQSNNMELYPYPVTMENNHVPINGTVQTNENETQVLNNSSELPIVSQENFYNQTKIQPSYLCNKEISTQHLNLENNCELWSGQEQHLENEVSRSQTISLPNSSVQNSGFAEFNADDKRDNISKTEARSEPMNLSNRAQAPKQSNSWFGGIFNKLSLMPKNQMILPDDKNPVIVWDDKNNKWVNTDNENTESGNIKPPPKMSDGTQKILSMESKPGIDSQSQQPLSQYSLSQDLTQVAHVKESLEGRINLSSAKAQSNLFKMQRGRSLKNSYVDVFNPSGTSTSKLYEPVLAPSLSSSTPPTGGFLVPGELVDESSIRNEADFQKQQSVPCFYNPKQFEF